MTSQRALIMMWALVTSVCDPHNLTSLITAIVYTWRCPSSKILNQTVNHEVVRLVVIQWLLNESKCSEGAEQLCEAEDGGSECCALFGQQLGAQVLAASLPTGALRCQAEVCEGARYVRAHITLRWGHRCMAQTDHLSLIIRRCRRHSRHTLVMFYSR